MGKKLWLFGVLVLLIVAAGCSSDQTESNGQTAPGTEEATEGGNAETISYTVGRMINPNDVNLVKLQEATGETIEHNRWNTLYEEELNITYTYEITAPNSDQYNQTLRLAMASDDLPDIFQVFHASDMKQLMDAGAIEELGPLYEEYGSDLLKSIIESETDKVFLPAMKDGKIYGIPMKMPSTNGYNHLWIREDWLEKLELPRPETMDDVYEIAKAFVEQDPDGNGQPDTYGLQFDSTFRHNAAGFFWGFGANSRSGFWIEKGDRVEMSVVQPEMKNALKMLSKMYEEGLIDREFGVKDQSKGFEPVVAGKTGMFYGPHWMAFTIERTLANDPDARWIVVPLPTETGEPVTIPLNISADGYLVVKKGTPHPENLIKMMNVYVDKLFGPNAEFNKYFADGNLEGIYGFGPVYTLDPMIDLKAHQDIKRALEEGTTDQLTGTAAGFYKSMEEGSWSNKMMFGPVDTPFAFVDQTYPDQVIWNAYTGAPTPTQVARGSNLEELIDTQMTSIIIGKVDADSGFDQLVEDWKAQGGDDITREVNEALGL